MRASSSLRAWAARAGSRALAIGMLALLLLPVLALALASSPSDLLAGLRHPIFAPALRLSAETSLVSLGIILLGGTPLALWVADQRRGRARLLEALISLPIVIPPAALGIALLAAFGRRGLFGEELMALGLRLPFTRAAVILAQVVISAPFYIQPAIAAFRRVDPELLLVARSLGQSRAGAFFRVRLPLALPGLLGGAALAWARSLGELGATLLFAGNRAGVTQTMPLAIFSAIESDLRVAIALSLTLALVGLVVLLVLRASPFRDPGRSSLGSSPAARTEDGDQR